MTVQSINSGYKFWPIFLEYLYAKIFHNDAQFSADRGIYSCTYNIKPRRRKASEHGEG